MWNGIHIREAVEADLVALADLQLRAVVAGYPEDVRKVLEANPGIVRDELRRLWKVGEQFLVALSDEAVVGFAVTTIRPESSEADLEAIFVEPAHWRRGVGRRLVKAVVMRLARDGVCKLRVSANPDVLGFYAALGFELSGAVQMHHRADVPVLSMAIAR